MPTWLMVCDFSHVYSLWISWQGVQLSHALVFHMPKPENAWRCHFTHMYHKWKCVVFCPTNNPKKPEKSKFWKNDKNAWRHILQKCTRNHMLYCSWEMMCNRCNLYFHFGLFLPFYATDSPPKKQWKIQKNNNKPLGDIILHMYTKNYDQIMHGSWDVVHSRQMGRHADRKSGI